jgi:opacity protein-like surface antigen
MLIPNFRKGILLACLAGTTVAFGQRFDFGVKGGVATMEPTRFGGDESKRYITGVSFEYRLWHGLAVEADFLYRHTGSAFHFTYNAILSPGADNTLITTNTRARAHIFEAPVLGKYYFRSDSKMQPYLLTGYSFRKAFTNMDNSTRTETGAMVSNQKSSYSFWSPVDIGATFGAGLRWRLANHISLTPEFRYTHWGGQVNSVLPKNQADVLLGIRF